VSTPASKPGSKRSTISKVGKYTLKQLLGQGGYGEVYAGEQKTGPRVAIKLLDSNHSRDDDAVARFKREAETARRLDHPNVVRVIDVGSSRNRHYIAMELVHGGSLRALMKRELDRASADKTLTVLVQAARALAYAHDQGVIHRDVKPANILLTRSGKAKVADFGLARAVDHSSMTTDGKVVGTAAYMSPEQARGIRATGASDVYSMGIILYEVITGAPPFQSDNQIGYLYQHAEVDPPRPSLRSPYPAALGELALECLAKDPDHRPTMARVADRLAAITLDRPRRISRILLVAAVVLVVFAILAIAVPRVLSPLCGDWFGGRPFCAAQSGARSVHDKLF
jgi:serine/threonine-protein kinase